MNFAGLAEEGDDSAKNLEMKHLRIAVLRENDWSSFIFAPFSGKQCFIYLLYNH